MKRTISIESKYKIKRGDILRWFIGGFFLLILYLIISIVITNKQYDDNLDRFQENFDQVALPPQTQQVGETFKDFGLMGNGNHCDYLVTKLIRTSLTKDELTQFFDAVTIPAVAPNELLQLGIEKRGNEPNTLYVTQPWTTPVTFGSFFKGSEQDKEMKIQEKYRQEKIDAAEQHSTSVDSIDNSVYILKSFDQGYAPNDIRCH